MKEVKKLIETVVEACEDRKAENIIALDMENVTTIADCFVICHGNNERQVQAIAQSVKDAVEEKGYTIDRMEGTEKARWILIDIGDVICHVFHEEERSYYHLERLWGDAREVKVGEGN